jgi:hypothetical protein
MPLQSKPMSICTGALFYIDLNMLRAGSSQPIGPGTQWGSRNPESAEAVRDY